METKLKNYSIDQLLDLDQGITNLFRQFAFKSTIKKDDLEPMEAEWDTLYSVLDFQLEVQKVLRNNIPDLIRDQSADFKSSVPVT